MDHTVVRKRIRLFIAGLCICLVGVILVLLIIDRVAGIVTSKNGYFLVSIHWYLIRMNFIQRLQYQLRVYEIHLYQCQSPQTCIILALGDSFTFGWGVSPEESWVTKVGSSLRHSGKSVEMVNAAYPGMDIQSELETCLSYAKYFDVDAVVIGMYITDDLYQVGSRDDKMTMSEKMLSMLFRHYEEFPIGF